MLSVCSKVVESRRYKIFVGSILVKQARLLTLSLTLLGLVKVLQSCHAQQSSSVRLACVPNRGCHSLKSLTVGAQSRFLVRQLGGGITYTHKSQK